MYSLLVATANAHKSREIAAILGPDYVVKDLSSFPGLPPVEETGATFLDNAVLKAEALSRYCGGGWVLADDSGLEVDALKGEPGVRSARYAGDGASDFENLSLLLMRLEGVKDRRARFRCVMVLAREGKAVAHFDGRCEGVIGVAPSGSNGFGYDPVFTPEGELLTFAELAAEVKNGMSHRGRALAQVVEWLRAQAS